MPKYTKSVRKNKRGRSRRGGYWFYPGPGDDEHAFTKLRNKVSSGSWKFWQKQPEEVPIVPDYQSEPEVTAPVVAEEAPMPEQEQGSLKYPSSEPTPQASIDQEPAPMDNNEAPLEPKPETPESPPGEQEKELKGGRRRRRSRTTKKRKRSNMRRRTNKRRRSNKRRR